MTTAMEMRLRKSQLLCHQLRALFELMYRYPVQQAGDNLDIMSLTCVLQDQAKQLNHQLERVEVELARCS